MSFIVWIPGINGAEWGVFSPICLPSIAIAAPDGVDVSDKKPSIVGAGIGAGRTVDAAKIETVVWLVALTFFVVFSTAVASRIVNPSSVMLFWSVMLNTCMSVLFDCTIVTAEPLAERISIFDLFTTTFSVYVPLCTMIVSPGCDMFIAAWIDSPSWT